MAKTFDECLQRYGLPEFDPQWGMVRRGIEKESLRVTGEGHISQASHPTALGSALTNPYITTDFSEALLEFITPVYQDIDECLKVLADIHRFTLTSMDADEMLWVSSMPCPPGPESLIPIAQYGNSNIGRLKTLYRKGLSHRYGSLMQVIAGLHYNFSMPDSLWQPYHKICGLNGSLQDFRTERYLHLIRNFHRYSWLLLYLFGASPAACRCFVEGREHNLEKFDEQSLYLPDATCLRMGNLGYKSEAQKSLFVCYNELETYVDCLHQAMHTPYPAYETIGQARDGEYLQINTSLLQLENEFYSTIRPKRVVASGERPLQALTSRGIEYVEVRALDLDPYIPLGLDGKQVRFLDAFLLHCLFGESPRCNREEFFEVASNLALVVEHGRNPGLELKREAKSIAMRDWAREILDDLDYSAGMLDYIHGGDEYSSCLEEQRAKLDDPDLTPSGRMLRDMREGQMSFFEFSMQQSRAHSDYFRNSALEEDVAAHMSETSATSVARQRQIEAADELDFDEFLRRWNQA